MRRNFLVCKGIVLPQYLQATRLALLLDIQVTRLALLRDLQVTLLSHATLRRRLLDTLVTRFLQLDLRDLLVQPVQLTLVNTQLAQLVQPVQLNRPAHLVTQRNQLVQLATQPAQLVQLATQPVPQVQLDRPAHLVTQRNQLVQ